MIFSTPIFLFLFLPLVLFFAVVLKGSIKAQNTLLLFASILFYAWGESIYVVVIVGSIVFNHFLGLSIHKRKGWDKKAALFLNVFGNLGLLFAFKYLSFVAELINDLVGLAVFQLAPIHLPIGISFFTFQALSYTIDLYRQRTSVQKNILDTALYISLFPQLLAGPIVRYSHIVKQLYDRILNAYGVAKGIRRFIFGLGKKVLIADNLATLSDTIFNQSVVTLQPHEAWIGAMLFALQIYYDFSGYSDMAIGLGKVFGFEIPENFNYPYVARSVREFWQRWHISLSTWFRDYLYIPLGGSRCSAPKKYRNLFIVFFLCGLWHGARLNFVLWGLFHGFFISLEHTKFGSWLRKLPAVFSHMYVLLVVVVAWVLFRSQNASDAYLYLASMVSICLSPIDETLKILAYPFLTLDNVGRLALCVGLVGTMPLSKIIGNWIGPSSLAKYYKGLVEILAVIILFVCVLSISATTFNPFIYFRF